MMKKTFGLLIFSFSLFTAHAQFYKSFMPSGPFTDSLAKVVTAFHNNFKKIQGESVSSGDDAEIYRSKIGIPGAASCVIYRFHSVMDSSASWQALMYSGDDYKDAVKSYKNAYRLIRKAKLKPTDRVGMEFRGDMSEPKEEIGFSVSTLYAASSDPFYDAFVAVIEMVRLYDRWEVHVNLHNKKDDRVGNIHP